MQWALCVRLLIFFFNRNGMMFGWCLRPVILVKVFDCCWFVGLITSRSKRNLSKVTNNWNDSCCSVIDQCLPNELNESKLFKEKIFNGTKCLRRFICYIKPFRHKFFKFWTFLPTTHTTKWFVLKHKLQIPLQIVTQSLHACNCFDCETRCGCPSVAQVPFMRSFVCRVWPVCAWKPVGLPYD